MVEVLKVNTLWLQYYMGQGWCQNIEQHAGNPLLPGSIFSLHFVLKYSELMQILTKLYSQTEAEVKKKLQSTFFIISLVTN